MQLEGGPRVSGTKTKYRFKTRRGDRLSSLYDIMTQNIVFAAILMFKNVIYLTFYAG